MDGADTGTSRTSPGPGGRAPPKGVRKDSAARISLLPDGEGHRGRFQGRAPVRPRPAAPVGDIGHRPVDLTERVAKLPAGLAVGMDPQTRPRRIPAPPAPAGPAGRRKGRPRRRRSRGRPPPRCPAQSTRTLSAIPAKHLDQSRRRPRRCATSAGRRRRWASTRAAKSGSGRDGVDHGRGHVGDRRRQGGRQPFGHSDLPLARSTEHQRDPRALQLPTSSRPSESTGGRQVS